MLASAVVSVMLAASQPKKVGRALVTFYWIIDESSRRYRGKRDYMLRDVRGNLLGAKFNADIASAEPGRDDAAH